MNRLKSFFKTRPSHILIGVVVVLVIFRLALPHLVKYYLNDVLDDGIKGYTGSVQDVDVALIVGSYGIDNLVLKKVDCNVPVPFLDIQRIDFSIAWKSLWRGSVVGSVEIDRAQVNFVDLGTNKGAQAGADGEGWVATVDRLFPLEIEQLLVRNSRVNFRNFVAKPQVDVYLRDLNAEIYNLTNTEEKEGILPSRGHLQAHLMESGELVVDTRFDIMASPPPANISMRLLKVQLPELNSLFKEYAFFDVKKGRFEVYSEVSFRKQDVKGYIKPFVQDVDILQLGENIDSLKELGAELGISMINLLIRDYKDDEVASKIPFEFAWSEKEIGYWEGIKKMFRHAFVENLEKGVDKELRNK